jgi:hypothetical protein
MPVEMQTQDAEMFEFNGVLPQVFYSQRPLATNDRQLIFPAACFFFPGNWQLTTGN